MVELALEIATKAHKGQVDKVGRNYIEHPITVASMCSNENEKIVALLHDVIEDSELTLEEIKSYGFDDEVVEALEVITKTKELVYQEYISKVKNNAIARVVKIADMTHNSDLSRLGNINDDIARFKKYQKAIFYLNS